ncbi:MAG: DoxX family membrane protein [Syntrophobacteraceae bacterium]|nr:DoxX family membrane protein [Syntrophobacteraceae bacterium]
MSPRAMNSFFSENSDPRGMLFSASRWFYTFVRISLGIVFLLASVDKILHPEEFAAIVHNYRIVPAKLVNLPAIILPWIEFLLGLLLIIGWWMPGAVLLSCTLLTVFLGILGFNAARGLDVQCGCFSTSPESASHNLWYIVRDVGFWLMALYLALQVFLKRRTGIGGRLPEETGGPPPPPGCPLDAGRLNDRDAP